MSLLSIELPYIATDWDKWRADINILTRNLVGGVTIFNSSDETSYNCIPTDYSVNIEQYLQDRAYMILEIS